MGRQQGAGTGGGAPATLAVGRPGELRTRGEGGMPSMQVIHYVCVCCVGSCSVLLNMPIHLHVQAAQLANEGVNIATAASYFRVRCLGKHRAGNTLGAAASVPHVDVDLTSMRSQLCRASRQMERRAQMLPLMRRGWR